MNMSKPAALERFTAKYVVSDSGCWLWQAALSPAGYAKFRTGQGRKTALAHRWSYQHYVGPIPEGLTLDHLCRTPACVNPAHLEPVTRFENNRRATLARTECFAGHAWETNARCWLDDRGYLIRQCRVCHRDRARAAYAARQLVSA